MIGDLEMEGVPEDSLSNEALSRDSSEALFSKKADGGESSAEKSLPHLVLYEDEIKASH